MLNDDLEEGQYVFDYTYENNLNINFMNNINLAGKNVKRATRDFERITNLVNDHAFAWNCLSLAYSKLGEAEKEKEAKKKTRKIVKEGLNAAFNICGFNENF